MDTKKLLGVARRIETLEAQLAALKNEARQIVTGQGGAAPAKKRKMSAEAKKRISEAMRRRWAAVKAAKKKG